MRVIKLTITAIFLSFAVWFSLQGRGAMRASAQDQDLLGTLSVPTSVTASDNDYSTKVGINWDTIRGATSYRIFRNTTNNTGTATDVGTTEANYFFDTNAVQGETYFYWVRAENGANVSGFSTPDQGVRSNGNIKGSTFAPLEPPPAPAGNPVTAVKAYLGKALFWDEQMSSTRTVSCGTCHRPAAGGSDPRTIVGSDRSRNPGPDGFFGTLDDVFGSPGVPQNKLDGTYTRHPQFGMREQVTGRKSPSYLNAGYSPEGLFWDGRATDVFRDPLTNNILLPNTASLESQSVGPPVSGAEMGHVNRNWTQVAARIQASKPLALATNIPPALATWINNRTYPQLFEEAFGTSDVTPARIAMAIATHERTLFSDRTPLDRELYGIQPLTAQEISGRELFVKHQCNFCHTGALLTNNSFHNIAVRPQTDDPGRFAVTNVEFDRGSFKTPQLRNGEIRGPFMHTGALATMEDVVEFYNRGGDFPAPNVPTGVIRPLDMTTQQKADLVAFLKRPLTDNRVANELPPFYRPTLPPGKQIHYS
jgi:cytochrome c peroxidase